MQRKSSTLITLSIAEQAYNCILERISTGIYAPGKLLKEVDLSHELGISRTPIREALQRLVQYGLVEASGRSMRVRIFFPDEVFHLYQVRRVLELEAVRLAFGKLTADDFAWLDSCDPGPFNDSPDYSLAAQKFDLELHRTIAERSGNPLLAHKVRKLHDRVQFVCRPTWQRVVEHREIIAALKGVYLEGAIQAMARHLDTALESQQKNAKENFKA